MPLHLDHRPLRIEDMVGNQTMLEAFKKMVDRKEGIARAFLFTGPSGSGKTTLARILARMLKVSSHDYRELNTADFRGVDTIREIITQIKYKPIEGRYRMWLLDEAHQFSKDAQNALLKVLEDSPEHSIIVLATTDPEKLLPTIKTRCHTFALAPLSEEELCSLMEEILKKEKVTKVKQSVLEQIARDSLGSARMALVLLDKIIDLDPSQMKKAAEQQAIKERKTLELCRLLLERATWKTVANCLKGLDKEDPEQVRQAVLGYMSSVLLGKVENQAYQVMVAFSEPFFSAGRSMLIKACFESVFGDVE